MSSTHVPEAPPSVDADLVEAQTDSTRSDDTHEARPVVTRSVSTRAGGARSVSTRSVSTRAAADGDGAAVTPRTAKPRAATSSAAKSSASDVRSAARSATTRSATTRSATTRSATTRSATLSSAATRSATLSSAATRSATLSSATMSSATTRSATTRSATLSSAPAGSATVSSLEAPDELPPDDSESRLVGEGEGGDGVAVEHDTSVRRYQVFFDPSFIDPDVRKVVRRLNRYNHEAYLVGGCVRDLLLSRKPKDFDVATSAHPEEVRNLFRNSRVIGRRFRLVHVMFHGRKVIEVATFRRPPTATTDGELIRNDNAFGNADEDAQRRDFTINALFYDPESNHILDWVGGMRDVRRRIVDTVGEPEMRFREDPVRILRAIKFAGRLDLGLAPEVYDAIVYCREDLNLSARPRVAEEILRLLRGGEARRSIYIAWETGVLDVLLPELAALLYDTDGDDTPGARVWKQLEYIDERHREGEVLDDTVLWTLLLLEAMKEACEGQHDRAGAVSEFLDLLIERLAITRRCADGMRRIVAALPRVYGGKPGRIARSDAFELVLDVAEADRRSQGLSTKMLAALRPTPDKSRRRR